MLFDLVVFVVWNEFSIVIDAVQDNNYKYVSSMSTGNEGQI